MRISRNDVISKNFLGRTFHNLTIELLANFEILY